MQTCRAADVMCVRCRPIGIGVQGLADTFILMRMAFDSPEVRHHLVYTLSTHLVI